MTGIFGILESSATQWYEDVASTQKIFFLCHIYSLWDCFDDGFFYVVKPPVNLINRLVSTLAFFFFPWHKFNSSMQSGSWSWVCSPRLSASSVFSWTSQRKFNLCFFILEVHRRIDDLCRSCASYPQRRVRLLPLLQRAILNNATVRLAPTGPDTATKLSSEISFLLAFETSLSSLPFFYHVTTTEITFVVHTVCVFVIHYLTSCTVDVAHGDELQKWLALRESSSRVHHLRREKHEILVN